ncbi:putative E3 ubiquitin-protein ligase SINAT1 [Folsomia candida]|uniref:RING-type E3 ubiquitin transferase n=1 Tax=Folsomia candida TaxID=158441 RepID=A0A226DK86_FOLCA|nr:putative E3 ubiquitin-protein ligase SINAT1 [Folsomia candida]
MTKPRVLRELGDLMDCTICLEEPASPIHSCANGHIICGICVDQVKKCGMCQTDLHVSHFAERLSRQFEFTLPCRNQNCGCDEVVAAAEMKNHLQKCYFRYVLCTESKSGRCDDAKVPLKEYGKHLQERHNQITGDAIYFWMTVLGNKETAEKYMFELKVFKTLKNGKKVEASWTIPIVAFHDRPKYVEDSPFYAVVPVRMVKEFGTQIESENSHQIRFVTSYRIF